MFRGTFHLQAVARRFIEFSKLNSDLNTIISAYDSSATALNRCALPYAYCDRVGERPWQRQCIHIMHTRQPSIIFRCADRRAKLTATGPND